MNATFLYVEACKCMLSLSNESSSSWVELFQILPKLRQALSCRVCRGLLVDPFGSQSCEHYVCRGCLKKKRSLNPGCRWCLNMEILIPDQQTKILLACYQKLCEFLTESGTLGTLRSQNGEYNAIVAVINEAMASPIGIENGAPEQKSSPENTNVNNNNLSTGRDKNMAEQSRGYTRKLPAEVVVPLPKKKMMELLNGIDGSQEEKPRRRKRKHFKGTIYNYNKKKKLKKSEEQESENLVCQQFLGTVQTIENAQDSNEEVQIVDEGNESELISAVPESPIIYTKCRCGLSSLGSYKRCAGKRCPCFSNYNSCEQCDCNCCSNPFNNNNERKQKELKPIIEDKVLVTNC